jgi:hypothetical protein
VKAPSLNPSTGKKKKRRKERKSQEDMQSPGRAISRKSRVLFLAI